MGLREGLHLVGRALLINPDLVRKRAEEQNLQGSFVSKVGRIYSTISGLPEAAGRDIPSCEIKLQGINWNKVDPRFSNILFNAHGYRNPSATPHIVMRTQFAPQEGLGSWLSLKVVDHDMDGRDLSFSVDKHRKFSAFCYGVGNNGHGFMMGDQLAELEGKDSNMRTVLEIANLAADFVSQALKGEFGAKISIEPLPPAPSYSDMSDGAYDSAY